jgi:hypothetical protein
MNIWGHKKLTFIIALALAGCGSDVSADTDSKVSEKSLENAGTISGEELLRKIGEYNLNKTLAEGGLLNVDTRAGSDALADIQNFENVLADNVGKRFEFKCKISEKPTNVFKNLSCYPRGFFFDTKLFESRLEKKTKITLIDGKVNGETVFEDDEVKVTGSYANVVTTKLPLEAYTYPISGAANRYVYGANVEFKDTIVQLK